MEYDSVGCGKEKKRLVTKKLNSLKIEYIMATENKKYEKHSFKSFLEQYHVIIPMAQATQASKRRLRRLAWGLTRYALP